MAHRVACTHALCSSTEPPTGATLFAGFEGVVNSSDCGKIDVVEAYDNSGIFFISRDNKILRDKQVTVTFAGIPVVGFNNLRSNGDFFAYGVIMTKGDGLPCRKCGTSEWDKRGHCLQCQRDRFRSYRAANPEWERERSHEWRTNNPEKVRERSRKWRRNNPEKVRERARRWRENNPEKHRELNRKWRLENPEKHYESVIRWQRNNPEKHAARQNTRRTKKTEAGGSYTADEFKALCKQYGGRCLACGQKKKLTADHVIPVIAGGTSDISNIQPLCHSCNSSKGARHTTDYRTKPGIKRWIQKRLFGE